MTLITERNSSMSSTEISDVLASIRRVVGEEPRSSRWAQPIGRTLDHGQSVSVHMTMMDSLQRSVSDAALADRARLDAGERLQAMSDAAFEGRNERYRTAHRDTAPRPDGGLAPIGVSADPALNAHHLAHVAAFARSEAETGAEAGIAAAAMAKATAEHDAALAARKRRYATTYRGAGQ